MAISPKSAIEKGKALENYIADQLIAKGIDPKAARSHGSGNSNREKSDIWTNMQVLGRQAGIEAKHCTAMAIPEWWRQTKKLEDLGYEPILVIKQTHETYDGTKAIIYLDTLLDLIKIANSVEPKVTHQPVENRELKYKTQKAVYALRDLLKELEGIIE